MSVMKRFLIAVLALALSACAAAPSVRLDPNAVRYPLIPMPLRQSPQSGSFVIDAQTAIVVMHSTDTQASADALADMIERSTGLHLKRTAEQAAMLKRITFALDPEIANDEGYELSVTPGAITIHSKTSAGAFWAVQTLRQLLPADIEKSEVERSGVEKPNVGFPALMVPAVEIVDAPRFAYRGVMLDVSRHYFPPEFLQRFVDLLALYKINYLHLHLTDDQGWRMEIKRYPRLAEISAWRDGSTVGHYNDKPRKYDGQRHGGIYTQEQLKALVRYAQARHITIVPEIELPGHSVAALAAYPELGCLDNAHYEVSKEWGVHNDIYCPKEATFEFLQNVLSEVMDVFPSKYIHIGGDEVPTLRWQQSPFAQALIRQKDLKNEQGLQSYFIQRIERFVNSKGRAIIGWDEILDGGLAPNATVMSWRGEAGGVAAAMQGHDVIMSPDSYMYLDHYQVRGLAKKNEPIAIGGYLPLQKVYVYDPVPHALSAEQARQILGVQGNLWTEYVANAAQAEYMAFPRVAAVAEVGWSALERKDYSSFQQRLSGNVKHLEALQVNFARHGLTP